MTKPAEVLQVQLDARTARDQVIELPLVRIPPPTRILDLGDLTIIDPAWDVPGLDGPHQPPLETVTLRLVPEADAYIPATPLMGDRFADHRKLKRFLQKHRGEIRFRNRSARRLEIHAGDWCRYWAEYDRRQSEELDAPEKQSFLARSRSVTDRIREEKQRRAR